ncbi:hypothetical protein HOLleu_09300 [Holothuria leucospilota]|uniref:Uncharacterized protein n=1 Tax=Holothuria leucospilota TaxID=206669 RepID=A0A9Q1CKG7_HOLLE|nr:hypothetical protein HOLleu_09300 [Holothuria leucospilota]
MICNRKFRSDVIKLVCRCGCKMYDLRINVKESFYERHSGGMRVILNGRKVTYRVSCPHPVLRHFKKKNSNELIPMTQRYPGSHWARPDDSGPQGNRVRLATVSGNFSHDMVLSYTQQSKRTFEKSPGNYVESPACNDHGIHSAEGWSLPNEVLPGPSTSSGRKVTQKGFRHQSDVFIPKRPDNSSLPPKRVVQVSIATTPQVFTSSYKSCHDTQ